MADITTERNPTTRQSEEIEPDPIADRSLSGPILISSLILVLTLIWALYDEIFGLRPWKDVQRRFVSSYTAYLKSIRSQQKGSEEEIRQSPEFQKIHQEWLAAEEAARPRANEIDREVRGIEQQLAALTEPFQNARAKIAALTYEIEVASSESKKNSLKQEIEEYKKGPFRVEMPKVDGSGGIEKLDLTFEDMESRYNGLKDRKASLMAERALLAKTATELRQKRDAFVQERMVGLTEQQIDGLIRKMENFTYEIKQIHIPGADLVDRCESCHLGIREPLTLTRASFPNEPMAAVFVSHPNRALLQTHNPDRFGCSTCHGGNGRATTTVAKAHGNYKHWLWPLYKRENVEAGCVQCHTKDRVLDGANVLNRGRDLFEQKGCIGCHRYEGFDRETDTLAAVRQSIKQLEMEKAANLRERDRLMNDLGQVTDAALAQRLKTRVESIPVINSQIESKIEELDVQAKYLMRDQKKVGPNLKDIRYKLRKEWIPVWLEDPQAFRPGTKMPKFRLDRDEREAISAFIWQAAINGQPLPSQPKGDATRGKELFETRGCLACHSIGEGDRRIGGTFAANLSRLGEKANYDYIVRWVHDPRQRIRPYCPHEKRDIGPEDYAKKGLPFAFGLNNSKCPNDGHELQVQQMTVMPSLRLSDEEARDIATYLISLKRNTSYSAAPFMDDASLRERGRMLTRRYGCASCHEISGLEDEGRIGTELTKEGSKPIERLDFALLTRSAKEGRLPDGQPNIRNGKKEKWYDHKGFFEQKLKDPAIFDKGKERTPEERLKMPNIRLEPDDITALTTFLLGSVETTLPPQFLYNPPDQRRDIQEGWWVIKKYNCMGCHNIQIGQQTVLETIPRYQDPDWKEQLPPRLTSEGARVDPNWLIRFLENPAMSETELNRNGVRPYLKARMPTFNFSPNEIKILVRFFEALSAQQTPYIAPKLEPLNDKERELARQLFTSQAAPCLKCHITGDPAHDKNATAPNFLLAPERLKPAWTSRWLIDPQMISPGTAMPSDLFRRQGNRWVFNGPVPAAFQDYTGDHVDLLVRYMFQITPEEQRRLAGMRAPGATQARPPVTTHSMGAPRVGPHRGRFAGAMATGHQVVRRN